MLSLYITARFFLPVLVFVVPRPIRTCFLKNAVHYIFSYSVIYNIQIYITSEVVKEIMGEHGEEYELWADPILEIILDGEIPAEMETLLFCLQTGIGVRIIVFSLSNLIERRQTRKNDEDDLEASSSNPEISGGV